MSHPPAKPGRPRSNTSEQRAAADAQARQDGSDPSVDAVQDLLCARLGAPRAVRTETLAREISTLLEAEEPQ